LLAEVKLHVIDRDDVRLLGMLRVKHVVTVDVTAVYLEALEPDFHSLERVVEGDLDAGERHFGATGVGLFKCVDERCRAHQIFDVYVEQLGLEVLVVDLALKFIQVCRDVDKLSHVLGVVVGSLLNREPLVWRVSKVQFLVGAEFGVIDIGCALGVTDQLFDSLADKSDELLDPLDFDVDPVVHGYVRDLGLAILLFNLFGQGRPELGHSLCDLPLVQVGLRLRLHGLHLAHDKRGLEAHDVFLYVSGQTKSLGCVLLLQTLNLLHD